MTAEECIRYALSLPVSTLCIGIMSMKDLDQGLRVGRGFKPLADSDKERLISMTAGEGGDGRHELFKSSQAFDGPHHRKQHGFAIA